MGRTQRRFAALLVLLGATGAAALVAAGGHPSPAPARASRAVGRSRRALAGSRSPSAPGRASTTTTTTTTVPATQTTVRPSASTSRFRAEMAALFRGIRLGAPAVAARAFFPESAYVRLKAIEDPAGDYAHRLMAEYRLDVEAAHAYLGTGAAHATLVGVSVPEQEAAWIPPGACANGIGYWHDPGARLVYREGGTVRSIGIASLISWHGVWYVVHLGGVLRSSTTGLVDAPAIGPGTAAPPGGC